MEAVGVIVEYNPFHNGHRFHLAEARKNTGADVVIAVMSGNFLQRGEPALCDKWTRAQMALLGGADIVFELPFHFAVQQADIFAKGAVSLLGAAQCKYLCFGSESGDTAAFGRTLEFLNSQKESYQKKIKSHVTNGVSYPKAAALAFQECHPNDGLVDLSLPNNILGFQYMRAIEELGVDLIPYTITRKNAGYHDEHFSSDSIASATSIRKAIFSGGEGTDISPYIPEYSSRLLKEYQHLYGKLHTWELYWPFLQYRLIESTDNELRSIYGMDEGLESRFRKYVLRSDSFSSFMTEVKTKRYTWTRLQRVCTHLLLNSLRDKVIQASRKADYLRLLGFTKKGRTYLQHYKKNLGLPLFTKASSAKNGELDNDIKAARIYAMGISGSAKKKLMEKEFIQSPFLEL
ncbi:nucleotidyltransferase [Bacillus massilinigeriensis]|uniref:nucleotidyltransferase n=1 Tax=Bacillus mediterraneensis TaxID=1805474 RepID=UPI0008F96990|nr:nucleotidyltransferase [Bacillus mediterraneensis]